MNLLSPPDLSTKVDGFEPGSWSISWKGRTWHMSEVTGEHLSFMNMMMDDGDTWEHLDMSNIGSENAAAGPVRLQSWIVAFVMVADEMEVEELAMFIKEVRETPVGDLLDCFTGH